MKRKLVVGLLASLFVSLGSLPAQAAEKNWSLEITPYAWLAGIDADVTVGEREGEVDVGFSDIVDYLDMAGGLLLIAEKNRWIGWVQGDYISLDSDEDVTRFSEQASLETRLTVVEAGVGYKFDNPLAKNAALDVLVGARYTRIENELDTMAGRSFESDRDYFDPMLVLRPWFPLTKNLVFNPTLGIGGGGDSDLIYELQPQFQYAFTDNLALRVGYRRLYYDIKGDRGEFDGSFNGPLIGLGMRF